MSILNVKGIEKKCFRNQLYEVASYFQTIVNTITITTITTQQNNVHI